jgi:hypothetical protein
MTAGQSTLRLKFAPWTAVSTSMEDFISLDVNSSSSASRWMEGQLSELGIVNVTVRTALVFYSYRFLFAMLTQSTRQPW